MEIKPSLHETEFKNCFGIYSKNQNLKFDKKFYDKLVELNFFVKEVNEDEKLTRFLKNDSISLNIITFSFLKKVQIIISFSLITNKGSLLNKRTIE